MVLNDRELRALLRQGALALGPFDDALVQPSSIDLRLHSFARLIEAGDAEISVRSTDKVTYQEIDIPEEGHVIPPGGVLSGQTLEHMKIPDTCVGLIEQRSSFMRLGIHVSSSLINPGYVGNLPCLISNRTGRPLRIFAGIPFCQLVLLALSGRPDVTYAEKKDAKYQNERRFYPSRLGADAQRWVRVGVGAEPAKLEDTLRDKVNNAGRDLGLTFESLRRASMYEVHLLCRDGEGRYWTIIVKIEHPATPLAGQALNYAIGAAADGAIDEFLKGLQEKHGTA